MKQTKKPGFSASPSPQEWVNIGVMMKYTPIMRIYQIAKEEMPPSSHNIFNFK